MRLRRFGTLAVAHRRRLVVVPLAIALLAYAATFAITAEYVASSTVQIVGDEGRAFSAQGIASLLQSRDVAQMVAADLRIDQRPSPTGVEAVRAALASSLRSAVAFARYGFVVSKQGSEAAVDWAQGALGVTILPGGTYLQIEASAAEPELAAAVVNAAADAVIRRSRALIAQTAADRVGFLDTQVASARRSADDARNAVVAYAVQANALQGESLRAALASLEAARASLRANELNLIDSKSRLAEVEAQLAVTPAIASSQTTQGTDRTITSGQNQVYVGLQQRANALRQEVAASEASRSKAEAFVNVTDKQFLTLLSHDGRLAALNQDLDLAAGRYSQLATELAYARSDVARPVSPVRPLNRAVASDYPVFPVRLTFVAFGLAAGAVASLLLLLILMRTDLALRSPEEIEALLGNVPLLAVVPKTGRSGAGDASANARTGA